MPMTDWCVDFSEITWVDEAKRSVSLHRAILESDLRIQQILSSNHVKMEPSMSNALPKYLLSECRHYRIYQNDESIY